jgi:hypothetical protein
MHDSTATYTPADPFFGAPFIDVDEDRKDRVDHLGFGVEPDELERLAVGCRQLADRDQRVELRYLEVGGPMTETVDGVVVRTLFVRYLAPVWFQFHWRSAAPAS